jgi:hypothetical protein
MKYYWEIVARNLKKAGWSWGWVSAVDSEGRTIWIADAHRDNGKRFIVRADEILTAFLELERVTRESLRFPIPNNSAQFFHDSAFIGLFSRKQAD